MNKFITVIKGASKKASPLQLITASKEFYDAYNENSRIVEHERTRRIESQNKKEVLIEQIQSQKEILVTAINQKHELNSKTVTKIFDVIDHALNTNDIDQLNIALSAIIEVTKQSSLRDIADITRKIQDPSNVIDI
ncbi:TPA: hypothetical protein ACX6QL_003448 [Photobacterium damselae]